MSDELKDSQNEILASEWRNAFRHRCGKVLPSLPEKEWMVCPACGEMFMDEFTALAERTLPDGSVEQKVLRIEDVISELKDAMRKMAELSGRMIARSVVGVQLVGRDTSGTEGNDGN